MKKFLCLFLALTMSLCLFACGGDETEDINAKSEGVMTWAEYNAAEIDSEVVIEAYVQAKQGWWYDSEAGTGKLTFYLQDGVGGYFVYEWHCTEDAAAKLIPGTKVRVTGVKAEWAGEVEIVDAEVEVISGKYVAEPTDVTSKLASEELVNYQNMLVSFSGLTVVSISYKNDQVGNDIYVTLEKDGAQYDFCVESYLTGSDTEVYQAVGALKAGDVIDVVGFAYWYNGINTHITGVTVK